MTDVGPLVKTGTISETGPIAIERLPILFAAWRARWNDRDTRMTTMSEVVSGDFNVFDPEEEAINVRSPNMIQVALEDTAEAASLVPTTRVVPAKPTKGSRATASKMEKIAQAYLEASKIELLIPTSVIDMAAYGFCAWTILPDLEQRYPVIEKRDAQHVYPEPGWRVGEPVRRCIMARQVYVTQLPPDWQAKLSPLVEHNVGHFVGTDDNVNITLVEYFDDHEYVIAGLYENLEGPQIAGYQTTVRKGLSIPVELERIEHELGVCPVVIGQRITLDGEPRGQFDQVVGPLRAHVELMGMVIDYSDQAVYSDMWVRDLIGEMPYGGGSFIELGPNGAIGRVPPAVTSLNVLDDLDRLADGIHLGGRWPKSRPGEIDQAIASGKFLEASTGMMNTAIRTYHMLLGRIIEQALRVAFKVDVRYFPGEKTMAGTLRSQEFLEGYHTDDIDLAHKVKVDYGLGFGRDPAQSAVLAIQYAGNNYISTETVQENIDGLTDIALERSRIDVEDFRKMAQAKILEGLQAGSIEDRALVEMARARANGDEIFDLYEKYVVEPKEEALGAGLESGLGNGLLSPGAGPEALAAGGAGVPGAPGGGTAGAPPVPPAPPPGEFLTRLGVPTQGGGLLGAQVRGGGEGA